MAELEAEICCLSPGEMRETIAILTKHGFTCHVIDWTDPCSSETRWVQAVIKTDLTANELLTYASDLVEKPGREVDVVQTGPRRTVEELAAV